MSRPGGNLEKICDGVSIRRDSFVVGVTALDGSAEVARWPRTTKET